MDQNTLNRRDLFKLSLAAGAAMSAPSILGLAEAAPIKVAPVPSAGIYRTKVGELRATIISDGQADYKPIQGIIAPNEPFSKVQAYLHDHFLPTDKVRLDFNILLLEEGHKKVLVDTGNGVGTGQLLPRLAGLGIRPSQITHIVLTHSHPDHDGGLLNAKNQPVFPNARIYLTPQELEFWTKHPDLSKNRLPAGFKQQIVVGRQQLWKRLQERAVLVKPGQSIAGVLELLHAPGHTPGHAILVIGSGPDRLLHIADTAHHTAIAENPRWTIAFDTDEAQASNMRIRVLTEAAKNRARILAYHLPFPGLGHVRKTDEGFQWIAEPMFL
jgi:glyoxylase-like metal-dependent hydrolase (beta-lactamase superfamily II)